MEGVQMKSTLLTLRWIPVTDASGRTRMEAVWAESSDATAAPAPTQAA
jgi:hypothetical protein